MPNINCVFDKDFLDPLEFCLASMHTHAHVAYDRARCPIRYNATAFPEDLFFAMNLYDYVQHIGYSALPLYDYYQTEMSICNQPESARRFLKALDAAFIPDSPSSILLRQYKAGGALRDYLECMRSAEIKVIENSALLFQDVMRELAREQLMPQLRR